MAGGVCPLRLTFAVDIIRSIKAMNLFIFKVSLLIRNST